MDIIPHPTATRRIFLTGVGSLIGSFGVAPTFVLRPATATPSAMAAAIREVVGEAELHQGRVKLDIPPLVENGNSVSVTVSVDSSMSELDHVKRWRSGSGWNSVGVVSVFNLESSGVQAPERRPRHDERYHEV